MIVENYIYIFIYVNLWAACCITLLFTDEELE